jgi:hypothetical protein
MAKTEACLGMLGLVGSARLFGRSRHIAAATFIFTKYVTTDALQFSK